MDTDKQKKGEKMELEMALNEMKTKKIWNAEDFKKNFILIGYDNENPYMAVIRKQDNLPGTVQYTNNPRLFHSFKSL